jgi:hypothetical protein
MTAGSNVETRQSKLPGTSVEDDISQQFDAQDQIADQRDANFEGAKREDGTVIVRDKRNKGLYRVTPDGQVLDNANKVVDEDLAKVIIRATRRLF